MSTEENSPAQEEQATDSNQETQDLINSKLGLLLNIGVGLTIELGTQQMKIEELLKLNKNSVIELDKNAGDPLDIKVNGFLIARGEVVVVNEKYGVRLTEVVSKSKRIENL